MRLDARVLQQNHIRITNHNRSNSYMSIHMRLDARLLQRGLGCKGTPNLPTKIDYPY